MTASRPEVCREICIGPLELGPGHPCVVVAEAGVNHNGDLDLAARLVAIAAEAGADAVKFQTFCAERIVTPQAPKAAYQQRTTNPGESQLEMLRRLELSAEAHHTLQRAAQERGILFLSTPFDEESADFLEGLDVPAFKISSGDLTNLPLLAHVARKSRPMLLSTGMASMAEVEAAVRTISEAGNDHLVLLHCVSAYPAPAQEVNLRAMQTLAKEFGVPVGYSDHTAGINVALAAVALGACVIEKHVTLDRSLPGPDHQASLVPEELAELVRGVRAVESALGHGRKEPSACEIGTMTAARKSLVAARNLSSGTVLTEPLIAVRRPGHGLPPALRPQLVGRVVTRHVTAGEVLTWDLLR